MKVTIGTALYDILYL